MTIRRKKYMSKVTNHSPKIFEIEGRKFTFTGFTLFKIDQVQKRFGIEVEKGTKAIIDALVKSMKHDLEKTCLFLAIISDEVGKSAREKNVEEVKDLFYYGLDGTKLGEMITSFFGSSKENLGGLIQRQASQLLGEG